MRAGLLLRLASLLLALVDHVAVVNEQDRDQRLATVSFEDHTPVLNAKGTTERKILLFTRLQQAAFTCSATSISGFPNI